MNKRRWTEEEISYLKDNFELFTCYEIAKKLNRSTRSVQHKFNQLGLKKRKAKVGDIVNGWKIVRTFSQYNGSQNITMAEIESIECNKKRTVRLSILTNNQIGHPTIKRPDLLKRNLTHGMSKSRQYSIWNGMKSRCLNNKHLSYDNYGGRGISICEEWMVFENFLDWCSNSGYSDSLTLDRIDNDGDYCPNNCRWATKIEQTINRRNTTDLYINAFSENKHIIDWANDERCSVSISCLKYRIAAGWSAEHAITRPPERTSKPSLSVWLEENYPDVLSEYVKA